MGRNFDPGVWMNPHRCRFSSNITNQRLRLRIEVRNSSRTARPVRAIWGFRAVDNPLGNKFLTHHVKLSLVLFPYLATLTFRASFASVLSKQPVIRKGFYISVPRKDATKIKVSIDIDVKRARVSTPSQLPYINDIRPSLLYV